MQINRCLCCGKPLDDATSFYHKGCAKKLFGSQQIPALNYTLEELNELSAEINNELNEKKERFDELVAALDKILDEIFTDYPNAYIPLTLSPTEDIDIMDLIVPKDFVQKCKMGG